MRELNGHDRLANWPLSLPAQSRLQDAIHDDHGKQRDRIILALNDGYSKSQRKKALKLACCAVSVHLFSDVRNQSVRPYLHRCKDRMCPFCAKKRSATIAADMATIVDQMKQPRAMVLTVKSEDRPLAAQLTDLRHWFAKLRRSTWWKGLVTGGVYTVEVTQAEDTHLWHPHLHIIFDGAYVPQKQLRLKWHNVTGHSEIVWIEAVHNRTGAVNELCKYIGKPQRSAAWTDQAIREYATAISGTRMVQSFGSFHGIKIRDQDKQPERSEEEQSANLRRISWLAGQGHQTSQELLLLIAARWTWLAGYIWHEHPQLEPEERKTVRIARALARIESRAGPGPPRPEPPPDPQILEQRILSALTRWHLEDLEGIHDTYDYLARAHP